MGGANCVERPGTHLTPQANTQTDRIVTEIKQVVFEWRIGRGGCEHGCERSY